MPTMSTMPLPTGWLNTPLARPGQFGASTMYRGHTRPGASNWQMLTSVEYAAKVRIDHNTNRTADSRANSRLPNRYIVNGMTVLISMKRGTAVTVPSIAYSSAGYWCGSTIEP